NFAAALASSVHLGQKVGSFTTATTWMALMKPENRKALKYLQALVQMKLRTMDEFAYGERLRDPLVTGSPSHEITRYQNKPGTRFTKRMEPVVQASCWRSLTSSKRTVLVLSNTSDQNVSVNIRTDEIPVGTMLTDLRGRVIAYGPGLSIVLEPFSWRTLRTKAKKDVQP
ncbi:MAG: hypothetical protein KAI66_18955, partial [Lentisphaeria bacterium]|nr:hypothetical protein [Lentisphaeria bacterium]